MFRIEVQGGIIVQGVRFLKNNKRTDPNKHTLLTFEEIKWVEKRTCTENIENCI